MKMFTIVSKSFWRPLEGALTQWIADHDFEINGSYVPRMSSPNQTRIRDDVRIYIVVKGVEEDLAVKLHGYLQEQNIECTIVRDNFFGPFVGWMKVLPFIAKAGLFCLVAICFSLLLEGSALPPGMMIVVAVIPLSFLVFLGMASRFPTILFSVKSAY